MEAEWDQYQAAYFEFLQQQRKEREKKAPKMLSLHVPEPNQNVFPQTSSLSKKFNFKFVLHDFFLGR